MHLLEVLDRDLVPEEVEERVLEGAGVAVREDEAVAVDPLRALRVALEEARCGRRSRVSGRPAAASHRLLGELPCTKEARGRADAQKRTWAAGAMPMGAPG